VSLPALEHDVDMLARRYGLQEVHEVVEERYKRMNRDVQGFMRADHVRPIRFPAEHRLTLLPAGNTNRVGGIQFTCTDCPNVILEVPVGEVAPHGVFADITKRAQRAHRWEMGVPE
jgi:hypothetical protein